MQPSKDPGDSLGNIYDHLKSVSDRVANWPQWRQDITSSVAKPELDYRQVPTQETPREFTQPPPQKQS